MHYFSTAICPLIGGYYFCFTLRARTKPRGAVAPRTASCREVCPSSQQVRRCRSLRPIGRDFIASIPTSTFLKFPWKLRKRVDESKEVLPL